MRLLVFGFYELVVVASNAVLMIEYFNKKFPKKVTTWSSSNTAAAIDANVSISCFVSF